MKILLTGGAGFIGFHVAQALLARGDEVVIVDDMNSYYNSQLKMDRLEQLKDQVSFHKVSVWDYPQLRKVFAQHRFDKICHLAAQAGVRYSMEDPFTYQRSNVLGTLNILELMREFGVKDLVF